MKPKAPTEHEDGLLEYLEDIIGTSKYKEPIDEALVKMEQLQEERQVKLNRLRLVEKEKSALEAKKREAEDYLRLKNEHVRALSRLWQWYLWQGLMREEQAQLDVVCGFYYLLQNKVMNVVVFFRKSTRSCWRRKRRRIRMILPIWRCSGNILGSVRLHTR